MRVLEKQNDGSLLIENLSDVGKIKVETVHASVEPDLIYPLLRGRDVTRWRAIPSAHIILAQDPQRGKGIVESEMKKLPKTFAYLRRFEGDLKKPKRGTLRGRALYKQYFDPSDPFYSMYNVGPYTLAPWKVVWRDMGSEIQVSVVGPHREGCICPEHHVMFVPLTDAREAHYLCAVLMSSPVQVVVGGYTTTTGISTHVLEHLAIPRFAEGNKLHLILSELSKGCHAAAAKEDSEGLGLLENEIDNFVAKLWGITGDELKAIQQALAETRKSKRAAEEDEEE